MAKRLEELPICDKAVGFWGAVNARLESPRLRKDRNLHEQISDANDSITSTMVEGFEQGREGACGNSQIHSRGVVAEVLKRLKRVYFKKRISEEELKPLLERGQELGKMLGGFIKYLRGCDWTDRGSHRPSK